MKKGDRVELKMQKILRRGMVLDDTVYQCEFLQYDEREECLYLLTNSAKLEAFSLDVVYSCEIWTDTERMQCTGRVKERYCQEDGKTLKIEIENGFYKITIKSVDKQMA